MTGVLKLHVHVCLRSFVHLCYCPTSAFWFPFVLKNYLLYVIFWVCKYIMYFCPILWAYLHEWHYREVTKYRGTQMQSYNVFVWTLLSGSHIWWARFQGCAHISNRKCSPSFACCVLCHIIPSVVWGTTSSLKIIVPFFYWYLQFIYYINNVTFNNVIIHVDAWTEGHFIAMVAGML